MWSYTCEGEGQRQKEIKRHYRLLRKMKTLSALIIAYAKVAANDVGRANNSAGRWLSSLPADTPTIASPRAINIVRYSFRDGNVRAASIVLLFLMPRWPPYVRYFYARNIW